MLAVRCVCVLPAGHPLSGKTLIRPADLNGLPMVTAPRDHIRTQRLMDMFTVHGAAPEIRVETPLFASMCAFVIAGTGFSIVDPITAHNFSGQGLVARTFDPPFLSDFAMLFPASKPRTLIARKFADLVREALREYTA